jgi:phosphoglycolate phosphatase
MSHPLPALIFDLDGTLTDSKPGILGCIRKVIDDRNLGDQGPLDRFIGPQVEEWVVELLPEGTEEDHIKLARDYRDCYDREGWSNNSVFPGVHAMLTQLRNQGFPLFVCTSKQERFAVRILQAFGLAPLFTAIYADKPEYSSHAKQDLLARLLRERTLNAGAQTAWMIGDRIHDFQAARANRIRSLAAGWGYGTLEEWAQADAVAATPAELPSLVLPQNSAAAARTLLA